MRLHIIYLAAGYGSRFGSNKLLHPVQGKPLFGHGLETLSGFMEACEEECVLTVVTQYSEIEQAVEALAADQQHGTIGCIRNEHSDEGIASSLVLGVLADREKEADAYLFCVADQPWLQQITLHKMLAACRESGKGIICARTPVHRGNPVLFAGRYRDQLLQLQGDSGGKQILSQNPEDSCDIYVEEEKELIDIDEWPFPEGEQQHR